VRTSDIHPRVSDTNRPTVRPIEAVTLRRSRPDTTVTAFVILTGLAALVVAPSIMRVFLVLGVIGAVVNHAAWALRRPTTVLDADGIHTSLVDIPWGAVEQVTITTKSTNWRAKGKRMADDRPLWLPAPALRNSDGGSAMDEFETGVTELRRWVAIYAPRVAVYEAANQFSSSWFPRVRGPVRLLLPTIFSMLFLATLAYVRYRPH
jgi:hypothetical protein